MLRMNLGLLPYLADIEKMMVIFMFWGLEGIGGAQRKIMYTLHGTLV